MHGTVIIKPVTEMTSARGKGSGGIPTTCHRELPGTVVADAIAGYGREATGLDTRTYADHGLWSEKVLT